MLDNRVHHSGGKASTQGRAPTPRLQGVIPKGWSPISELLVLVLTDGVSTHHGGKPVKTRGARKEAEKRDGVVGETRTSITRTATSLASGEF
uniref:Uncharacterized protein n=1 Tax=Trichogramma kaykai TaxID=54128 RepID=A0ABD2WMT9_9HYME